MEPTKADLDEVRSNLSAILPASELQPFPDALRTLWKEGYRTQEAMAQTDWDRLRAIGLPSLLCDLLKPPLQGAAGGASQPW